MRNLKKILALVLALIMSLSLMATAGAGSFQDVTDDNPYKTAIDVLDELKVFQGYKEDGTFRPTETLNRAQAAVLVYRVATGDVEDKYVENYTYMAQSKFNDLDGYNWAKGYINYCQNAKIVVGTSATTFSPEAPVTGYQLMVMLLRTLGYGAAGEFTDPKGWELETAKIAEREGLLKNVTGGDFGNPAPRQMVAEILFRGLLHDTVQYSPLTPNGYTESGEILGKRVGLEEVTGVVVANEWANLEGSKPLAEGKTILKVDGKNRTIDVSSTGADLGTSVHVYLKGATVLTAVEDAGNDIRTNEGNKTTVKKLLDDLDTDIDTEYFVNYGPANRNASEYRLKYMMVFDTEDKADTEATAINMASGETSGIGYVTTKAEAGTDADGKPTTVYVITRTIIPGKIITSVDMDNFEEIFSRADKEGNSIVDGAVYVGTQSNTDISDVESNEFKYSYNKFVDEFINDAEAPFSSADQGESLRVIDNDGDGVAEYVLKVEFVMTTIKDYDKKTDSYLVEYDESSADRYVGTAIKASAIKAMDGEDAPDLSAKAVILYSKIDGVYYTKNPVVEAMTIDKKGIDTKNDTFTVDGEDHIWSGIFKTAAEYYNELEDLVEEHKYNFFLDYFGNARLACEINKGFVLLTDGYFWSNRREDIKKVELYDDEAGKLIEAEVTDYNRSSRYDNGFFIDALGGKDDIDDSWKRLNPFGTTYYGDVGLDMATYGGRYTKDGANKTEKDPFTTNVASYVKDDEGKYSLYDVTDGITTPDLNRDNKYRTYEIAGTHSGETYRDGNITVKKDSVSAKDYTLYGIKNWNTDDTVSGVRRIMATSNTQYYLVTRSGSKQLASVESWVGYSNVPEDLGDFVANKAYAVTHDSKSSENYDVADVVVFEGVYKEKTYDAWLVFAARSNTDYEYSLGVDPDGEDGYGRHLTPMGVFKNNAVEKSIDLSGDGSEKLLRFWTFDDDGEPVDVKNNGKSYSKYGIHVGEINTLQDVKYQDYITFGEGDRVDAQIPTADDLVEYRFVFNTKKLDKQISAVDAEETTRLHDGDKVIYMLNADSEIALIVNLSDSCDEDGNPIALSEITALNTLYDEIKAEQDDNRADPITFENVTVKGKKVDLTTNKITIPAAVGKNTEKNLSFTTNADNVTVAVNGTALANSAITKNGETYSITAVSDITAQTTYTILLGNNGTEEMIKKTITVDVGAASGNAVMTSFRIKGVEVTNIPGLVSGAATIDMTNYEVGYDANQDTTIRQIEVVTSDPNATWAVNNQSAGFNFDTTAKTTAKTPLNAGGPTSGAQIVVTAEDGTTATYTLNNLTVKDAPLTLKGADDYTNTKYNNAGLTTGGTGVTNSKDIEIVVTGVETVDADSKEIDEVTWKIETAAGDEVVAETQLATAPGTYTISKNAIAGKEGILTVTVKTKVFSRDVSKVGSTGDITVTGLTGKVGTSAGKVSKDVALEFTVAAATPDDDYVESVTYTVGGGQSQTATLDADGKFTVPAGTGAIVVTVVEKPWVVFTNGTGGEITAQGPADANLGTVANNGTIKVKANETIQVVTSKNTKPVFADAAGDEYEIVGKPVAGTDGASWIWTVKVIESVSMTGTAPDLTSSPNA